MEVLAPAYVRDNCRGRQPMLSNDAREWIEGSVGRRAARVRRGLLRVLVKEKGEEIRLFVTRLRNVMLAEQGRRIAIKGVWTRGCRG